MTEGHELVRVEDGRDIEMPLEGLLRQAGTVSALTAMTGPQTDDYVYCYSFIIVAITINNDHIALEKLPSRRVSPSS